MKHYQWHDSQSECGTDHHDQMQLQLALLRSRYAAERRSSPPILTPLIDVPALLIERLHWRMGTA